MIPERMTLERLVEELNRRLTLLEVRLGGVPDYRSIEVGITASTTQSQGQRPLTSQVNRVDTVANANDAVTLPECTPGLTVVVANLGANALQVFPASGDSVGTGSANASVSVGSNTTSIFRGTDTSSWIQLNG